ncbi:MAG: nucleotidyltransferase substrate binding protein [Synergistaceae bacterium]|jgi:nucleotidyltransferase substrate binding protein (TIGR01987 family)|nr:nucleotidyltransferase substrate binding protein [Synergistaceae bacterium]
MSNSERWRQRFQNFENAYDTFCRTMNRYEAERDDEIVRMALVQAFEFTYELAWKTMKDYLENEGYDEVGNSKQTIRVAFQAKLIRDAEKWMEAISKRNLASHVYNPGILDETVEYITGIFSPLVRQLYEDLKTRP